MSRLVRTTSSCAVPPNYESLTSVREFDAYATLGHKIEQSAVIPSTICESQPLQLNIDISSMNGKILVDRLCEYILLLRDLEAKHSRTEADYRTLEKTKNSEIDGLSTEIQALRDTYKKSLAEADALKSELEQMKKQKMLQECVQNTAGSGKAVKELEYKPVHRSPEDMMKTRFEILAQLPLPIDAFGDVLKPIGIPERFTLHEFLLGSASGSLRNALSGYCTFTEKTTMWCPEREEHGFYLTPLYKCDTGPRSNVIHRWVKVDVKARMPKPTECFFNKDGEWYYTGTYKSLRLENLTPQEFENLSQAARDALFKDTLSGRKNVTPQILFETSQLYAAGALKVAVVGIQCVGFNHMLYSVALQQAQRFRVSRREKIAAASGNNVDTVDNANT